MTAGIMTTQPTTEQAFHDFEQAGWQQAAARYAETGSGLTAQFLAPLLDAAGVRPGLGVLDVATGPGHGAGVAAARGAAAVGVDFSRNMLAQATSTRG
jgi:ubiquinone/menaquinone biosynthesis C-methylase UbiE